MKKMMLFSAFMFLLICLLVSCTDSPGLDLYLTSETNATMFKADFETENVTGITVTMGGFEVHQTSAAQDSGWVVLTPPSDPVDIMQIENIERLLSNSEITEGDYNQIRFLVQQATVTTDSGTYTADVPSEKIKIATQFTVASGDNTEVVLSIDPEASLKKNGNTYKLDPVIHVKRVKNPNAMSF